MPLRTFYGSVRCEVGENEEGWKEGIRGGKEIVRITEQNDLHSQTKTTDDHAEIRTPTRRQGPNRGFHIIWLW